MIHKWDERWDFETTLSVLDGVLYVEGVETKATPELVRALNLADQRADRVNDILETRLTIPLRSRGQQGDRSGCDDIDDTELDGVAILSHFPPNNIERIRRLDATTSNKLVELLQDRIEEAAMDVKGI